jgi:hypothetical protein
MDKIWWNEAWMGWPVGPWYADSSNVVHAPKLRASLLLTVGELDRNVDPRRPCRSPTRCCAPTSATSNWSSCPGAGPRRGTRALVLAPTRELVMQILEQVHALGGKRHYRVACIIGGEAMGPQVRALREQYEIIVATPGRLCDHLNRGNVRLDQIEVLVLDEADRMLDMGFRAQLDAHPEASRAHARRCSSRPPSVARSAASRSVT